MDAIIYLRQEHAKFRRKLAAIARVKNTPLKKKKFYVFTRDLLRHEKMEEKKWYPALRKKVALKKVIKHLVAEEKSAEKAIKKSRTEKIDLLWNLRFLKLKHDIDHHARDEEKKLFPKVRKLFTKSELNTLGTRMRKFKAASRKK